MAHLTCKQYPSYLSDHRLIAGHICNTVEHETDVVPKGVPITFVSGTFEFDWISKDSVARRIHAHKRSTELVFGNNILGDRVKLK